MSTTKDSAGKPKQSAARKPKPGQSTLGKSKPGKPKPRTQKPRTLKPRILTPKTLTPQTVTQGSVKAAKPRLARARAAAPLPPAPLPAGIRTQEATAAAAPAPGAPSKPRTDSVPRAPAAAVTLPVSHGQNHLLLLPKDPQTLFAAWDMSPVTGESLRARLGRRAFSVSTLTLRLTRAGAGTDMLYVDKESRSHYLKIDGGPSFVAELGFTTPSGRFEPVAHSAPCFVPTGAPPRTESQDAGRREVVSYRDARSLAGRELTRPGPRGTLAQPVAHSIAAGPSPAGSPDAALPRPASQTPPPLSPRPVAIPALGGASDLYRW